MQSPKPGTGSPPQSPVPIPAPVSGFQSLGQVVEIIVGRLARHQHHHGKADEEAEKRVVKAAHSRPSYWSSKS